MELKGKKIGFVMTGSFCTFKKTIEQLKKIIEEQAEIIPIMSFNAYNLDTKFGKAKDFINEVETITRESDNSYDRRSRAHRSKAINRHNDNSTSYRKYHGKTS